MKDLIINNTINFISKYNSYNETKLEELRYGLVSIYLLVSKLIVIVIFSIILGILKEMIIFTLLYIPVRAVSFGLHASKSWICLVGSLIVFIGIPFIANSMYLSNIIKSVIGITCIILMFKNSPADTHKRPIINKRRRLFFKYSSVIISIIYTFIAISISDNFIANCLLSTLITQCIIIDPLTYKIFKMPYNNYKIYN